MPSRQWQFDRNALEDKSLKAQDKKHHPKTLQPVNLLLRTDTELKYGEYLHKISKGKGQLMFGDGDKSESKHDILSS